VVVEESIEVVRDATVGTNKTGPVGGGSGPVAGRRRISRGRLVDDWEPPTGNSRISVFLVTFGRPRTWFLFS